MKGEWLLESPQIEAIEDERLDAEALDAIWIQVSKTATESRAAAEALRLEYGTCKVQDPLPSPT